MKAVATVLGLITSALLVAALLWVLVTIVVPILLVAQALGDSSNFRPPLPVQ